MIVAAILDAQDWETPTMSLVGREIGKQRIDQAVLPMREAERLDDVGGFKLWELRSTMAATK